MPVVKITLDTNCIINLFDARSLSATSVDALFELVRLALVHRVDLAVTTRSYSDLETDRKTERKAEMLRMLRLFPIIGTTFRAGVSWAGHDMCVSSQHVIAIQNALFPGLQDGNRRMWNKQNDIDHLVGHAAAKRDIFITDDRGILGKGPDLLKQFGIDVRTPSQCLEHVKQAGSALSRSG